jgi:XTP/dITP diphosphohydrolase
MLELIDFYFATGNEHKLEEARAALSPHKINITKFEGAEKLEIQHTNLEEIAKAALSLIVTKTDDKLVFVEDSGLFVHELNGFPGPYSSFGFETIGIDGILKLMRDAKNRKAEFRSSVSLGTKGMILATFSSVTEGMLTAEAKGENGFGFDPIFVPMWTNKTFGQMELKEKTVYSHRAKALLKMALWYLDASKKKTIQENAIYVTPESTAKVRKEVVKRASKKASR